MGNICRNDASIVAFGKSVYQDSRQDRRKVMGPMRLVGHLLERFCVHSKNKTATVEEMLRGPNWPQVEMAILELAQNNKSKIHVNISHILRNTSRLLLAEFIISDTGGHPTEAATASLFLDHVEDKGKSCLPHHGQKPSAGERHLSRSPASFLRKMISRAQF